jgi:hypothetical protein
MKRGDLVYVRLGALFISGKPATARETKGVILDSLEDSDGFFNHEVLFDGMIEWFSDLDLRSFNKGM